MQYLSWNAKQRTNMLPKQRCNVLGVELPLAKFDGYEPNKLSETINNSENAIELLRATCWQICNEIHAERMKTCRWDGQGLQQTRGCGGAVFCTLANLA